MSIFIPWAAKATPVNYLGIVVNVPTEFLEHGYIAMDYDGTIWAYIDKPTKDTKYWHAPAKHDPDSVAGLQIFELDNYSRAIPELGDSGSIGANYWSKSLVKISDCKVLVLD